MTPVTEIEVLRLVAKLARALWADIENQADTRDGPDGEPRPNAAMSLMVAHEALGAMLKGDAP